MGNKIIRYINSIPMTTIALVVFFIVFASIFIEEHKSNKQLKELFIEANNNIDFCKEL